MAPTAISAKLARFPCDKPSATAPLLNAEEEPIELVLVPVPDAEPEDVDTPAVDDTVEPKPDDDRGSVGVTVGAVLGTPEEEDEEVEDPVEDSVDVAAPIEKEPVVAKMSLLFPTFVNVNV